MVCDIKKVRKYLSYAIFYFFLFVVIISFVLIVFTSCGNEQEHVEEDAVSYELIKITLAEYETERVFSAKISGCQDIRIVPRVEGYLQNVCVKEGERVRKDQLLFVIDQTEYRGAVKTAKAGVLQAEALLEKSRQEYDGKKALREKNVISDFDLQQTKIDYEVAKANLEAAKAQLDIAENALSFTELRSPSDGVIGKIFFRKGDFVGPSIVQGLTIVSDNHQMYVYFSLSEKEIMGYASDYRSMTEIVEHMPQISLILPTGKLYESKGGVESISGIVDEQTGAVSVRAVFPNENGLLLSGGTSRVVMQKQFTNAIVIPQEATYEILDKIYVYKVVDGKAVSTTITIENVNDGKSYVVSSGLVAGDTIISKGASLVREGDLVQ